MEFYVGHRIQAQETIEEYSAQGYGYIRLEAGETVTVTRVGTHKVLVKPDVGDNGSAWFEKSFFVPADPNAPRPRKLGEAPEGMIAINDPRIDWIWRDAATYAAQSGYCSEYDRLVAKIGIPGREKSWDVYREQSGIRSVTSVSARSKDEAMSLARAKFEAAGLTGGTLSVK